MKKKNSNIVDVNIKGQNKLMSKTNNLIDEWLSTAWKDTMYRRLSKDTFVCRYKWKQQVSLAVKQHNTSCTYVHCDIWAML